MHRSIKTTKCTILKVHQPQDIQKELEGQLGRLREEIQGKVMEEAFYKTKEQLADQDTLAPVADRRAFVRELTRNLSYSERYGTPSSVIYLDLNGLKQLNDTKGHAAGDAAILKVANLLASKVVDNQRPAIALHL